MYSDKKCNHEIKLEGIEDYVNGEGYENKRPIYWCPECKEHWER